MRNILIFFLLLSWSEFLPRLCSANPRPVVPIISIRTPPRNRPTPPVPPPREVPLSSVPAATGFLEPEAAYVEFHTPVVSDVHCSKSSKQVLVDYATIAKPDALKTCPLETLPPDLNLAITQLVKKVSDSISKIKSARTETCDNLQQTLNNTQAELAIALQNQFIAGQVGSTTTNQAQINLQTQQASAVNLMILTASNLIQRKCIESLDDRVLAQRLIGQMITLGGLFLGGWQGVAMAGGGQLFANIPLFKNDVDTAVELFQRYDEITERGSFLCLYRQILKTSCLLFSEPEDQIVYGLDLEFKSGPTGITENSVREMSLKQPRALHDAKLLSTVVENAAAFMTAMEKPDVLKNGSLEAFQELRNYCTRTELDDFHESHPIKIHEALTQNRWVCKQLKQFSTPLINPQELPLFLAESYWSLSAVKAYFSSLKFDRTKSPFSLVLNTWESKKYFANFKSSMGQYRDHLSGNQTRMNYLNFTEKLGDEFATTSFKTLMKQNYHKYIESEDSRFLKLLPFPFLKPTASQKVRQRAAYAMMDLCQTLDPTLACLTPGIPSKTNALYKLWVKTCAGPSSHLCKTLTRRDEHLILIDDKKYQVYFDSLCGTNTSTLVPAEAVRAMPSGISRFSAP